MLLKIVAVDAETLLHTVDLLVTGLECLIDLNRLICLSLDDTEITNPSMAALERQGYENEAEQDPSGDHAQ